MTESNPTTKTTNSTSTSTNPPAQASSSSNNNTADAQTRGMPYYEKLKKDLRETITKKRVLDKNLSTLEDQIYRYEASYLEETGAGNIIKGFDNYIKGSSAAPGPGGAGGGSGAGNSAPSGAGGGGGGGTSTRRKGGIGDLDRVFSRSSTSFMRELSPASSAQVSPPGGATPTAAASGHASNAGSQGGSGRGGESTPTGAVGTKAAGAAGGGGGGANQKKGRKVEKEEDEDSGKPPKRLKITYSRSGAAD